MASFLSKQPYKGTRDFYPSEMRLRKWIFSRWESVLESFGFEAYDGPMLEPFELYSAKSGEELVRDQLYHFVDRGERKVAIRPEMTPTMARMVAAKFHELPKPVRWYSMPNLWRYENPQRGRLREHWQLNCDLLGGDSAEADFEILEVIYGIMEAVGGTEFVEIKINHRALMDTWTNTVLQISPEQTYGLYKLIDAMGKLSQEVFSKKLAALGLNEQQCAQVNNFVQGNSLKELVEKHPLPELERFWQFLQRIENSYLKNFVKFDPSILRGLDYYTGFVFEAFDKSPDNRRALLGGGRYDNLIGLFGKDSLSGVGFGMGDVTFTDFLVTHQLVNTPVVENRVFLGSLEGGEQGSDSMIALARTLRNRRLSVIRGLEPYKVGHFIKAAIKKGARFVVFQGEEELKAGVVTVKDLQTTEQVRIEPNRVGDWILLKTDATKLS